MSENIAQAVQKSLEELRENIKKLKEEEEKLLKEEKETALTEYEELEDQLENAETELSTANDVCKAAQTRVSSLKEQMKLLAPRAGVVSETVTQVNGNGKRRGKHRGKNFDYPRNELWAGTGVPQFVKSCGFLGYDAEQMHMMFMNLGVTYEEEGTFSKMISTQVHYGKKWTEEENPVNVGGKPDLLTEEQKARVRELVGEEPVNKVPVKV